ncbi:MAG: hypothetical protein IJG97_03680 [Bacilli bacterium]|nr:hypothetical protein [Bacilli bacterium]
MKKVYLLLLLLICLIPINIYAADNFTVDNTNVTVKVGQKTTVKVTATNSAGRLDISSADANIAISSKESIFLDNNTETIEIEGKKIGKTEITIIATANYATYDEKRLEGENQTITVNVISDDQQVNVPNTAKGFSVVIYIFGLLILLIGYVVIMRAVHKSQKAQN